MLLESVRGKNILFISPEFFGLEKNIIRVLKESGANVAWYDERSVKSSLGRAVNSICPYVFVHQSNRYYFRILKKITYPVDVILVIKGEMISKKTIARIRNKFPNAEVMLYLYDSVKNVKGILGKTALYDRVISFDPDDCKRFGFEFRPLFCSIERETEKKKREAEYDVSFYGTMYGDRFGVIKTVKSYCERKGIRFYSFCFLRGKFLFAYYFLTNKGFRLLGLDSISFQPKSTEEVADIVSKTKAVLDINDICQRGLTIRTLEALISGRKIITTNESIKEYDLFNEENIYVMDRKTPVFPLAFLEVPFAPISQKVREKYTAEGWARDVFV